VPFLQYFKDYGRLATVDVTSGDSPSMRIAVNNLLTLDNVSSWQPAIVFAIGIHRYHVISGTTPPLCRWNGYWRTRPINSYHGYSGYHGITSKQCAVTGE